MTVREDEIERSWRPLAVVARTRTTWPPVLSGRAAGDRPVICTPDAQLDQEPPSVSHSNVAPLCEENSNVGLDVTVANCAGVAPLSVVVGCTSTVIVAGALGPFASVAVKV